MARANDREATSEPDNEERSDDRESNTVPDENGDEGRRLTSLFEQIEHLTTNREVIIRQEEFIRHGTNDPERVYDLLCTLHERHEDEKQNLREEVSLAQIQQQKAEAAKIRLELDHRELLDQRDTAQAEQRQLTQERDTARHDAQEAAQERDQFALQLARNRASPASTMQEGSADHKTAKIPDPPLLSDGKSPRFEDWLLAIKQKLRANADHFPTTTMRIAYIASRCEEQARKHITPRLRDNAVNPYGDAEDMFTHLENVYGDPNRERVAKAQYQALLMKPTDPFHELLSEFLYLAAEAGVNNADWKDDLYNKLTFRMQELVMPAYNDDDRTFREFTDYCSKTATNLDNINKRRARATRGTGNPPNAAAASPAIKPEPAPAPRASTPGMDPALREQLLKEGKCFYCKLTGHISRECPTKKARAATPARTQLKALEQAANEDTAPVTPGKEDA